MPAIAIMCRSMCTSTLLYFFFRHCVMSYKKTITSLLLECLVYICDFHREQAWECWLSKISNGMSHLKTKALAAMRRIARARTVEAFEEKVQLLKDDKEVWGQSLFRKWLRQHKASPFAVVQYNFPHLLLV